MIVRQLHLGVALDGAGQHPGAPVTAPLMEAATYLDRARRAEEGLFDFVVLDDGFVARPEEVAPRQGRLDALLTLARVAPLTSRIGLVATVNTTHTEPFNVAKNVATLDWVSLGRAGWRPVITTEEAEYALFGRRELEAPENLHNEAGAVVDVVGRLCDSWEDGAIIRDQSTGRYIDRDKVHYVDFESPFFKVRGPSITPRSPQAQPLVVIDAAPVDGEDTPAGRAADATAARWADIIVIDGATPDAARTRREELRAAVVAAGRDPDAVFMLVRLEVLLGATPEEAEAELAGLDAVAPWRVTVGRFRFVGAAAGLAATLVEWAAGAAADGFVLQAARLPVDLDRFVHGVVPTLSRAGVFRGAYDGPQLRDHFGLSRPTNRYTAGV